MLRSLVGAVGGLLYWLGLTVAAIWPSGLGWGWMAPLIVSFWSVILFPITGILLSISATASKTAQLRRTITARVLCGFLVALDGVLLVMTISEANALRKMFIDSGLPLFILIFICFPWAGLWAVWHYIVISIAMERM